MGASLRWREPFDPLHHYASIPGTGNLKQVFSASALMRTSAPTTPAVSPHEGTDQRHLGGRRAAAADLKGVPREGRERGRFFYCEDDKLRKTAWTHSGADKCSVTIARKYERDDTCWRKSPPAVQLHLAWRRLEGHGVGK